jgi:hypothetical protein
MRMSSRAWPHRFDAVPWDEIAARFGTLAAAHPELAPVADIAASVRGCGAEHRLAGLTSMHDLVVTTRPVPEPPIEVVVVRSPSSGYVGPGGVFIEHRSASGHDDRIFRPAAEAVPLFWLFMIEKFGVEPPEQPPVPA